MTRACETLRAPATCTWQRERPESDASVHGIAVVLRSCGSAIAEPATVVPGRSCPLCFRRSVEEEDQVGREG